MGMDLKIWTVTYLRKGVLKYCFSGDADLYVLVESIGLRRGEGDGEGVRGGGACTHGTEVPKVSHFPSEPSLVCDGHSVLPLRTSCRPIHRLPGVCTSHRNIPIPPHSIPIPPHSIPIQTYTHTLEGGGSCIMVYKILHSLLCVSHLPAKRERQLLCHGESWVLPLCCLTLVVYEVDTLVGEHALL